MKKIFQIVILISACTFWSCEPEIDKVFDDKTVAEFQATVTTSPAVGKTYPLVALINRDSTIGTQVNLVGAQRAGATDITVSIDKTESTAVENTHFKLPNGGKVTIPANTSFANFQFQTIKATGTAGTKVNVVFIIETSGDILPNENYKRMGYTITL